MGKVLSKLCPDCFPDEGKVLQDKPPSEDVSMVTEAIDSMIEDVRNGETSIPSFSWKYRKGFGSIGIGPTGAIRLAGALRPEHRVTSVDLQGQAIGNFGCSAIAGALARDHVITALNLSRNGITETGAGALSECLNVNETVSSFYLEGNPIKSAGVLYIAQGLRRNTTIQQLHIGVTSGEQLEDSTVIALIVALRESRTLQKFKFSGANCGFSVPQLCEFFESLPCNASLQYLSLCQCVSVPSGMRNLDLLLPPMQSLSRALLANSTVLKSLELRLPLGERGCEALAEGVAHSPKLESLSLARCGIGTDGLRALAAALTANTVLQKLDLSYQKNCLVAAPLSPQGLVDIATSFRANKTLAELNLTDLPMTNEVGEQFCAAFTEGNGSALSVLEHTGELSDSVIARLEQLLESNSKNRTAPQSLTVNNNKNEEEEMVEIEF